MHANTNKPNIKKIPPPLTPLCPSHICRLLLVGFYCSFFHVEMHRLEVENASLFFLEGRVSENPVLVGVVMGIENIFFLGAESGSIFFLGENERISVLGGILIYIFLHVVVHVHEGVGHVGLGLPSP